MLISKETYFDELRAFGELTPECFEAINQQLFDESKNNVTWINTIEPVVRMQGSKTGLIFDRSNTDKLLKELYNKYSHYIQPSPAKETIIDIAGYCGKVRAGYQIIAKNENEFLEQEGSLLTKATESYKSHSRFFASRHEEQESDFAHPSIGVIILATCIPVIGWAYLMYVLFNVIAEMCGEKDQEISNRYNI